MLFRSIVWEETTTNGTTDVYAQRFSPQHRARWSRPGICVSCFRGNQSYPRVVPAGDDGVFVVWQSDSAGKDNINIWCQRIAPDGTHAWQTPLPVCVAPGNQTRPAVASDIDGGILVAWEDTRRGDTDIYGQYVQYDGSPTGSEDGVPVEVAPGEQTGVKFTRDTNGVVTGVSWLDKFSPMQPAARVETDLSKLPIPEPAGFLAAAAAAALLIRRRF